MEFESLRIETERLIPRPPRAEDSSIEIWAQTREQWRHRA
jgi:hypothetical protein